MSLLGQQSMSSLASPSPQQATSRSIFATTQHRTSQFAPPAPDGPASAPSRETQAVAALSSEEQEAAQQLGFGEGLLAPSSRRRLQAQVLRQEIRSTMVITIAHLVYCISFAPLSNLAGTAAYTAQYLT